MLRAPVPELAAVVSALPCVPCADLEEILSGMKAVETKADTRDILKNLGGFKKSRRDSKDLSQDTLKVVFDKLGALPSSGW